MRSIARMSYGILSVLIIKDLMILSTSLMQLAVRSLVSSRLGTGLDSARAVKEAPRDDPA